MGDSIPTDSLGLLDQLLDEVHQLRLILNGRLGSLENNVCMLSDTCNGMAAKLETVEGLVQLTNDTLLGKEAGLATSSEKNNVFNCPDVTPETKDAGSGVLATSTGVLRLPGVEQYPDGTWLGDPDVASRRVRSPITPQNLLHINSTCMTAEKMALTLLDYLFSRDELASSNISGRSRNNKKQLDPMMVYGIRCHLQYKFEITTKEWNRICQNMDSKCRSAFKRKQKLQHNLGSQNPTKVIKVCHTPIRSKEPSLSDDIGFDFDQLHSANLDLSCVKVMTDSPCELRILHPSPGSLDALPDSHEIVLAEDGMLSSAVDGKSSNGLIMSSRRDAGHSINLSPITMTTDSITLSGGNLHHNPVLATSIVHQPTGMNTSFVASPLAACAPTIHRNQHHERHSVGRNASQCSVLQSPLMSSVPQSCRLEAHEVSSELDGCRVVTTELDGCRVVTTELGGCRVTTELDGCRVVSTELDGCRVVTSELQSCPTPLSCPSLSLSECDVEHTTDELSGAASLEDDTSEGVIVIAGEPSSDDGDGILEIGVGDTLSHHNIQDHSPSCSPSPPPYKLLSHPSSSFSASLSLPSSSIKDEMDGQDISDDLDESMHSIHQSPLHHLSIGSLAVLRTKEELSVKSEGSLDS
ncbi:uncharacterized protein LOC108664997 [Hyalella azteca]|uniref:Protein BANP n=1 Tax=Hyalella azteca TaxID=294128 RepID=A0A8B7N037_HYAAZ|nr:uncharacterized protein LOC108664997 [Hyalella azteca]